jgi:hypothetical protein
MMPLFIHGAGIVAPGLSNWTEATAVLTGVQVRQAGAASIPAPEILPKNERRRSTPAIRLALEATHQAAMASGLPASELATVFGSSSGDGDVVHALLDSISTGAPVSPTHFHNSVHNAPAGYWAIATKCHQPSLSLAAYDFTVAATLFTAVGQGQRGPVIMCVYDAPLPPPLHVVRPVTLPFGAALVLSSQPGATALGQISASLGARDEAPTVPGSADLRQMFDGNPAARLLPILEALACRRQQRVVLSWDDAPPLVVEVAPC